MSLDKCKCTMPQRLLGTGCRYCNPQEYIDTLHQQIDDDKEEQEQKWQDYQLAYSLEKSMADTFRMFIADMVEAGVIKQGVAPMFITEAVMGYILNMRDALQGKEG